MNANRQRIAASSVFLRGRPDRSAEVATELIHGEEVAVTFSRADWSEVENLTDGYKGFIDTQALGQAAAPATDRVDVLRSHLYPEPNLKVPPVAALPFLSRVRPGAERNGFVELTTGGWIYARHLVPLDTVQPDFGATARRFVGVPYLWGGRTPLGLDCSALVQLCLATAGIAAPRDTGPQRAALGQRVLGDAPPRPLDLIFWPGHVAIMVEGGQVVHANATSMSVAIEPLAAAAARVDVKPEIRRLY